MINGILNIRKEPGYTSCDVVAKLRGIVHQKKIGHTGTLDPDAVGVLPVCLGKATRLCDMLTDETKTYETVLLLGCETDTQDTSGQILRQAPVTCTEEEVRACVQSFVGRQMQVPPMYSAKKVQGRKLYELAREGIVIERKAVPVTFYEIEILHLELPRVTMRVTCSKGTYIRTLCNDIGEALGCCGCMEHLVRTRVGNFCLEQSVLLEDVKKAVEEERLDQMLVSIDTLFSDSPAYEAVSEEAVRHAVNGNEMPLSSLTLKEGISVEEETDFPGRTSDSVTEGSRSLTSGSGKEKRLRLYLGTGEFVGIFRYDREQQTVKPVKMFLERP